MLAERERSPPPAPAGPRTDPAASGRPGHRIHTVARAGERDRAGTLADEIERVIHTVTNPAAQVAELAALATALAQAGEHDRAWMLADEAELFILTIDGPRSPAALAPLVTAWAQLGEYDRAEQLARTLTDPYWQAEALTQLVTVSAQRGAYDRAEQVVRIISDSHAQARALTGLVTALAKAGEHARARSLITACLGVLSWLGLPLTELSQVAPDVLRELADRWLASRGPAVT